MKNQTSKSPNSEGTPKKMGRPRGRKSDPSYRQVTIYLPTELHDRARQMVGNAQLSTGKAERRDFSGLVEFLLRDYFQTSESPKQSLKLLEMSAGFQKQSAEIGAMSEEEWTLFSQNMSGAQETEDTEEVENDAEMAELHTWAAQGMITAAEFDKLVNLMRPGRRTGQEVDWIISVRRRVENKNIG